MSWGDHHAGNLIKPVAYEDLLWQNREMAPKSIKTIRFSSKSDMAFHHDEKPYKTC